MSDPSETPQSITTSDFPSGSTQIPYQVTAEGSLGLLALGAVGVRAWRQVRNAKIAADAWNQDLHPQRKTNE